MALPTIEHAASAMTAAHPGLSGIHPLRDGAEAFAARALLADAAERSIDAQYYIWHGDLTGTALFAQLIRAAHRGVQVRLLLDDNPTRGLDGILAAVDEHQNVEVRIFNPFKRRRACGLDFILDFNRVNRRMHNKSFTVDGQATIVGGRNVGDEYFGTGHEISFEDLDVLAVGPIVDAVSGTFEEYWNSAPAVPLSRLVQGAPADGGTRFLEAADRLTAGDPASRYRDTLRQTPLVQDLIHGRLTFEWTDAALVFDPPSKILSEGSRIPVPVLDRLRHLLGDAQSAIDLVSPYFVPTRSGADAFRAIAARGVRARVLTNSLAATDVAAVHAGYAKYRRPLLDAGVELYELKPVREGVPNEGKRGARGGSSGASLHAKCFAVDRSRAYIGSFNFDPRSARLNTEMGIIVHSPTIATRISDALDRDLAIMAYQVRAGGRGGLEWIARDSSGESRRYESEPAASLMRRLSVSVLSLLPIERQL